MTIPAKSLSIPCSSVLSGFRWALHSSRWFITWPASSWGMSCKKNVRQREYYLNKFWDVRYPKSAECFKLKLKVPMNFGVCVYVCVVLDMDAISLDINWKRWKLYKLLKSAKCVYCMYHHLAHEIEMPGQNLITMEERLPPKRGIKEKMNIYSLT